jgi:hypothetical protein
MTSHAQPTKLSTSTLTSPAFLPHNGLLYTANKVSLLVISLSTITERPPPGPGKLSGKFPCQKVLYVL